MEYSYIALELLVGYMALFVMTKFIGKTLITQITFFDFITSIVLGELIGNALYDGKPGIPQILFSVFIWGALIYFTELITQKFRKTRSFLEGSPSVVIDKGKLSFNELKKNKIDINQLQHLLRSNGVFSIREVEYAILETDGTLSVLKKYKDDAPTRADQGMTDRPVYLPEILISDGELIEENLVKLGLSEDWLYDELDKYNLKLEEVLYAEWLEGEGLFVQGY